MNFYRHNYRLLCFSCNVKKSKTTVNKRKKKKKKKIHPRRNKRLSNGFHVCILSHPSLYCCHFVPSNLLETGTRRLLFACSTNTPETYSYIFTSNKCNSCRKQNAFLFNKYSSASFKRK